jgi:hypothetical protein
LTKVKLFLLKRPSAAIPECALPFSAHEVC